MKATLTMRENRHTYMYINFDQHIWPSKSKLSLSISALPFILSFNVEELPHNGACQVLSK